MTSGGVFAFVGRQRELGLLLAAVRHPPSTVLVEGEAGIGKSRLIREAAAVFAAECGRVLTGFCHPLREPFPFGPVVDALRDAGRWLPPVARLAPSMGAVARLLSDLGGLLPVPPERAADANAERFQLVQGLRSFLGVIGPAMLVVEDATENLPSEAAPLGAAYRRPGTSGVSIRLDPLPEEAVHELARDALGLEATAELGSVLFQRSEGLPLVAEEDLITLREHRRGDVALAGIAVNGADYVTNAAALRRILADPKLPAVDRGDIRLTLGLLMINHAADHAGNLEIARAAEELADRPDRAARAMMALALNEKDGASDQAWVWMERAELVAGRSPASPTCAVKSLVPS